MNRAWHPDRKDARGSERSEYSFCAATKLKEFRSSTKGLASERIWPFPPQYNQAAHQPKPFSRPALHGQRLSPWLPPPRAELFLLLHKHFTRKLARWNHFIHPYEVQILSYLKVNFWGTSEFDSFTDSHTNKLFKRQRSKTGKDYLPPPRNTHMLHTYFKTMMINNTTECFQNNSATRFMISGKNLSHSSVRCAAILRTNPRSTLGHLHLSCSSQKSNGSYYRFQTKPTNEQKLKPKKSADLTLGPWGIWGTWETVFEGNNNSWTWTLSFSLFILLPRPSTQNGVTLGSKERKK